MDTMRGVAPQSKQGAASRFATRCQDRRPEDSTEISAAISTLSLPPDHYALIATDRPFCELSIAPKTIAKLLILSVQTVSGDPPRRTQ